MRFVNAEDIYTAKQQQAQAVEMSAYDVAKRFASC